MVLRIYMMVGGGIRGKNIGCLQVSVFDNSWIWIHKPNWEFLNKR